MNQGSECIAIGYITGYVGQGLQSIAIGDYAGYADQGAGSVAIGFRAGYVNQAPSSIILNASMSTLNAPTAGLFISPIRYTSSFAPPLTYDLVTNEVAYSDGLAISTLTVSSINKYPVYNTQFGRITLNGATPITTTFSTSFANADYSLTFGALNFGVSSSTYTTSLTSNSFDFNYDVNDLGVVMFNAIGV